MSITWQLFHAIHAETDKPSPDWEYPPSTIRERIVKRAHDRPHTYRKPAKVYVKRDCAIRPGEVRLKEWIASEARRLNVTWFAAFRLYRQEKIKPKSLRRVNSRVIFAVPAIR